MGAAPSTEHGIAKAWAKFSSYKNELTDKQIPLYLRLKLFHSVVTPSMLYGCAAWVMTQHRDQALRSTEMRMMRAILGRKRVVTKLGEPEEPVVETWVEWVRRATAEAREAMRIHNVPDWVEEQRGNVLQWNEKLEQMELTRWARQVRDWIPEGRRPRGHPCMRWADQLQKATLSR